MLNQFPAADQLMTVFMMVFRPVFIAALMIVFMRVFMAVLMPVFMRVFMAVLMPVLMRVFMAVLILVFMRDFMVVLMPVFTAVFMTMFIQVFIAVFMSKLMKVFMKVFMTVFMKVFMKKHPVFWTGCQMYPQNKFCRSTVRTYLVAFGSLRMFFTSVSTGLRPVTRKKQKNQGMARNAFLTLEKLLLCIKML